MKTEILLIFMGILLVAFGALIGGTIVWLIWPIAIPETFPKLVDQGCVAAKLHWWTAVCLVWVFAMLFKNHSVNTKND